MKHEKIVEELRKRLKAGKAHNLEALCNEFGLPPSKMEEIFYEVADKKSAGTLNAIPVVPDAFQDDVPQVKEEKTHQINIDPFFGESLKFGATADSHLASVHHLGDATTKTGPLWDFYRTCGREGVSIVFHGGNWLDGHARFNQFSVKKIGITAQVEMFLNEYPYQKGVRTAFVAGDDHEGWWWQREGIDIAEYVALKAAAGGRDDMDFIGYLEADIAIVPGSGFLYNKYKGSKEEQERIIAESRGNRRPTPKGQRGALDLAKLPHSAIMKLLHGGGGTGYAKSVQPQKIVNSYESGEKPQILLIGHYHKADYNLIRNTHVLQLGTTEEQSDFMRKKVIPADVGSWLVEINQSPTGEINRFNHRFIPYFGRDKNFHHRDYTLHDGT